MAKKNVSLTEDEKKELQDLIAKKKANKLNETEAARLAELNKKCGFKGKGKNKGKGDGKTEGFRPGNDFSWWNKIPELLKDAANYKCNYIAGSEVAGTDCPFILPGVVKIGLKSVYGCNVHATDTINVWARDLYLRMFQKYRPASGYTASDLGIALIAALEAVKLIAKYERIYGVINRYSVLNVNMPLVEAEALGLSLNDVDYLQSHLSDFRYDLNFLIRKAQRLCIPKDMSAIADAISLFGYEYLDHENTRAQIIMFDFDEVGVYYDTLISVGGAVQFEKLTPGSFDLFDFNADNMCQALDTVLQALLGSDSIQRIFADLIVWFGPEAMLQFMPIPEEYVVAPVYSESILHKMHNLEMFNTDDVHLVSWADPDLPTNDVSIVTNGNFWVYQVNDRIVTKAGAIYTASGSNSAAARDGGTIIYNNGGIVTPCTSNVHVVDTYRTEVNEETVTEGVLFKFHSRMASDAAAGYVTMLDSCGFYIATQISIHTNKNSPTTLVTSRSTAAAAAADAGALAILDWAPLAYFFVSNGAVAIPTAIYGDLDSIIPMYGNGLIKLQRTIMLSGLHTDVKTISSSK